VRHTPADYVRCAASGMTASQAAEALGVKANSVVSMKSRKGVTFAKAKMGRPANRAHDGGLPRHAIAKALGTKSWTAGEMARYTGIAEKSARYHLGVMLKAGLVTCDTNTAHGYLWRKASVT